MKKRLDWVDQARGLSIFLVVYGHNFPAIEPYIYSFHVPLFFFISGMFHPKSITINTIKRRAKMILIPYFFWAFSLYLFWLFIGRKYGVSSQLGLSPVDNFIGIFYSQGGQSFMDWGIPIWFLTCIFLVFLIYSLLLKIKNKVLFVGALTLCVLAGMVWPKVAGVHLPWSFDVALVATGIYAVGNHTKNWMIDLEKRMQVVLMILLFTIHIITFLLNTLKVDMYRSLYGQEILFLINGISGSVAYILLLKTFPILRFLSYLGRHTIVLLATHTRALTLIKLILMFIIGTTVFEFSEIEKLILTLVQIILVIPVIWLVNKYIPILDGKAEKT
jgi:fucose 4-O-acetylase-like acetyltransferase